MDLPDELLERLAGYTLEPIQLGESGASVYRCAGERMPTRYLKVASLADDLRLDQEADRLRWMRDRDLRVPAVCDYGRVGDTEFLLLDEVVGLAASDPQWLPLLADMIPALGAALAVLHRSSAVDCPFDQRLARQIDDARARVAAGRVDEDDFDDMRAGRRAADLFAELEASVPASEDLVFVHGDYCLPNIILHREPHGTVQVSGFIDCGRSGVADRYQDIALAIRSITYNFGEHWVPAFLAAYGLSSVDAEKVAFYSLLDEFF